MSGCGHKYAFCCHCTRTGCKQPLLVRQFIRFYLIEAYLKSPFDKITTYLSKYTFRLSQMIVFSTGSVVNKFYP